MPPEPQDQQIQGLPPGAIVKPIGGGGRGAPQIQGLPPGAVVKPMQGQGGTPTSTTPVQPPESTLERTVRGVGRGFENIGSGLVGTAKLGLESVGAMDKYAPDSATTGLVQGSMNEFGKAKETLNDPYLANHPVAKYAGVAGHALAGALPGIGPAAAQLGEQIGTNAGTPGGDVAGPIAEAATTFLGPSILGRGLDAGWNAAEPLRNSVAEGMVSPLTKNTLSAERNAARYGHNSERALVGEGVSGFTKASIADNAKAKLADIGKAIGDTLNQPKNAANVQNVEPIIDGAYQTALTKARQAGVEDRLTDAYQRTKTQFGPMDNNLPGLHKMQSDIRGITDFTDNKSADSIVNQFRQDVSRRIQGVIKDQVPGIDNLMKRYGDMADANADLQRQALKAKGSWMKDVVPSAADPLRGLRAASTGPLSVGAKLIGKQYPFPAELP